MTFDLYTAPGHVIIYLTRPIKSREPTTAPVAFASFWLAAIVGSRDFGGSGGVWVNMPLIDVSKVKGQADGGQAVDMVYTQPALSSHDDLSFRKLYN